MDELTNPGLPETFQATVGRRRVYLSRRDVDAYEAGYRAFLRKKRTGNSGPMVYAGPWWDGYSDGQDEHTAAIAARNGFGAAA